jgi:hypothetical protein
MEKLIGIGGISLREYMGIIQMFFELFVAQNWKQVQ